MPSWSAAFWSEGRERQNICHPLDFDILHAKNTFVIRPLTILICTRECKAHCERYDYLFCHLSRMIGPRFKAQSWAWSKSHCRCQKLSRCSNSKLAVNEPVSQSMINSIRPDCIKQRIASCLLSIVFTSMY